MFTEIGIENFKTFGKMQRIPLKPITLLYGPNSSGKSSLLQSLLLFKQTLEESADDKIVLLPKGNLVDLGGYHEFINGHDTRKDFHLLISFKYSWPDMEWQEVLWPVKTADLSLEFSFSQDKTGDILMTSIKTRDSLHADPIVEWKNVLEIPHLKRAVLKMKGEFEKDGSATPEELYRWLSDLKRSVLVMDSMDMASYLLKNYWDGYGEYCAKQYSMNKKNKKEFPSYCEETKTELTRLKKHVEEQYQKIDALNNKLNANATGLEEEDLQREKDKLIVRQAKLRQLKRILRLSSAIHRALKHASYEEFLNIRDFPASDRLISIANCFPCDKEVHLNGEEWVFQHIPEFAALGKTPTVPTDPKSSFSKGYPHLSSIAPMVYDIFNNASNLLPYASPYFKEYLRRIVYIGPLREYPERVYSYSGNIPSNVGKSGKYTPDILLKRPDLVAKVNEWFDRFDIGYNLKIDVLKRNLFSLSLVDKKTGAEVSPKDVGFGIGQLLPILVQGVLSENKIMLIEQPEIHVHPRLQADLGSFFAEMAGRTTTNPGEYFEDAKEEKYGNQFIIETHSENLILRLQKLIRKGELKKEDVAVIYFDKTSEGTVTKELRLNDRGEFIDPWPNGFFEESFEEMFG